MRVPFVMVAAGLLALTGCGQPKMENQPRYETYEPAAAWSDNMSARRPPPGTVARDQPIGGMPEAMPMPVTRALLDRGHKLYAVNCVPCHGAVGYGHGMVVQRGFPRPPSYHIPRLRAAPRSYFVHVITHGYGVMYSYADRVEPSDRWAVAAYIKALQLSQHTRVETLTAEERETLEGSNKNATNPPVGAGLSAKEAAAAPKSGANSRAGALLQGISGDGGQP